MRLSNHLTCSVIFSVLFVAVFTFIATPEDAGHRGIQRIISDEDVTDLDPDTPGDQSGSVVTFFIPHHEEKIIDQIREIAERNPHFKSLEKTGDNTYVITYYDNAPSPPDSSPENIPPPESPTDADVVSDSTDDTGDSDSTSASTEPSQPTENIESQQTEETITEEPVEKTPPPLPTAVVTEYMLRAADKLPQWIEIYNPEETYVYITGWKLHVWRQKDQEHVITLSRAYIPAKGFLVLVNKDLETDDFGGINTKRVKIYQLRELKKARWIRRFQLYDTHGNLITNGDQYEPERPELMKGRRRHSYDVVSEYEGLEMA